MGAAGGYSKHSWHLGTLTGDVPCKRCVLHLGMCVDALLACRTTLGGCNSGCVGGGACSVCLCGLGYALGVVACMCAYCLCNLSCTGDVDV